MIPIKNAASGAAAVAHDEPERAPNQYADQIAYIKHHRGHKQSDLAHHAGKIQHTDYGDQTAPQHKHLIGCLGGGDHVVTEGFMVDLLLDRLKTISKQLLGTKRHLIFDWEDLQDHVKDPNDPQQMKKREFGKKVYSVQNGKAFGGNKTQNSANQQNQNTAHQTPYILFSCGRHRILLSSLGISVYNQEVF